MKFVPGMRGLSRTAEPAAVPTAAGRRGTQFLAAVESTPLLDELRHLLRELLGEVELEVIPQDGPVAWNRLRGSRPDLTFLPMDLRLMEGLTLLRALPAARARQVVLLVPDTVEGYRVAWEALCLGARDFMVTRGAPPQRLKGGTAARLRQLAHLLTSDEGSAESETAFPVIPADPATAGEPKNVTGKGRSAESRPAQATPWILLPESRHLAGLASWLRALPAGTPGVVRVPEGTRFLRVVRDGLGRLIDRPVRELSDGDRLVPGHVHLLTDLEVLRLRDDDSFVRAGLSPLGEPPGTWGARHQVLRALLESPVPLRLVLPDGDLVEEEDLLREAPRHLVSRLEVGPTPAMAATAPPAFGEDQARRGGETSRRERF